MCLPKRCSDGKAGQNPTWDTWSQDPLGHTKTEVPKCIRVPKHQGKEASYKQLRSGHSAWCCHKLQTMTVLGHRSPSRGPARRRTKARPHSLPWEEQHVCPPQESVKCRDSNQGHMTEITMFSYELGEHRQQTKTRDKSN